MDRVAVPGVDIVHDLTQFPYPFDSESVDRIFCYQLIEHMDKATGHALLRECHRILKVGGTLDLRTAHAFSIGAHMDPTHRSTFTYFTADHFSPDHLYYYYGVAGPFSVESHATVINLFMDWTRLRRPHRWLNQAATRLMNAVLLRSTTLPDLLVKILPLWHVEVSWLLRKLPESEEYAKLPRVLRARRITTEDTRSHNHDQQLHAQPNGR